jgi:threonine dehydrogenase-like Zn-dependent dehydrogenase
VVSEPNRYRRSVAARIGLQTVDPATGELSATLDAWTGGAGVDAAFEASGSVAGLETATHALRVRGRLVVVAIHNRPVPVDLFRVFWRELELIGARVYERRDFERAVALLAEGAIPPGELISAVEPLERTPAAFEALESGSGVVKVLIDCRARR